MAKNKIEEITENPMLNKIMYGIGALAVVLLGTVFLYDSAATMDHLGIWTSDKHCECLRLFDEEAGYSFKSEAHKRCVDKAYDAGKESAEAIILYHNANCD